MAVFLFCENRRFESLFFKVRTDSHRRKAFAVLQLSSLLKALLTLSTCCAYKVWHYYA
uniref:Uncharacterized protein n=1 Tax=Anguilla anguilla TaxID=7936 RepID=A0A0E9X4X8_ANGAN